MSTLKKVLVFAASNSRASINKQLVTHAAEILKEEIHPTVDIDILDLNDFEMPIYSIDRETTDGIPEAARQFYAAIGQADALLISYAEHNGLYTVAFKNIFDWCSRIDRNVFQDKPMVIMAASPGAGGGANVLKTALEAASYFGADIKGSLSVGRFSQTFNSDSGELADPQLASALREQLNLLLPTVGFE
ncbi:MAG: NADPH-dependent FMN reductase [Granulosicoccus sp.]